MLGRLYNSHQLEAIRQTKVDLKVYLGNYPVATGLSSIRFLTLYITATATSDSGAAYRRQRDLIKDALQTYGTDHVEGITVGNEFMLK